MRSKIITTIPVRNGQEFILQTLKSLANQTLRPDRVIVLDNCSTDATPEIVKSFKDLPIEFVLNPVDLGFVGNYNRCLDFAAETNYLQILHADDVLQPEFYEALTRHLDDCQGRALGWCLDERIDANNKHLSISGKADGRVVVFDKDVFLARKAEIGNQAFCATLLKTNYQPVPVLFLADMPVYCDMVYWATFGAQSDKIILVNRPLAQYRWHGTNMSVFVAPKLKSLVMDAWTTMQMIEALRKKPQGLLRKIKLKGLMAVRCGIMAKRFRQLGNLPYSRQIVDAALGYTGRPLWLAGKFLVELRELVVFKICRRQRHIQNIFS